MNLHIQDINRLISPCWFFCPHCKTGQTPKSWGLNKCEYKDCLKEYQLDENVEIYKLILKSLLEEKGKQDNKKQYVLVEREPVLQKYPSCYKLIPQGYEYIELEEWSKKHREKCLSKL